jgi:hypothetical protein
MFFSKFPLLAYTLDNKNTYQGVPDILRRVKFSGQLKNAIAIGDSSGFRNQGINTVAVGREAGKFGQGSGSVSIGYNAGNFNQGSGSISIGSFAGYTNQGMVSIYEWENQQWSHKSSFVSPRPTNEELFGSDITIGQSGNTYYMAVSATESLDGRGRVYLYTYNGTEWKHLENQKQMAKLQELFETPGYGHLNLVPVVTS